MFYLTACKYTLLFSFHKKMTKILGLQCIWKHDSKLLCPVKAKNTEQMDNSIAKS